jgi:2-keto-4-pentenoate hydratase/2-oxohepta-3-ene-1,7-dioic acid hydratase in catechol pathway
MRIARFLAPGSKAAGIGLVEGDEIVGLAGADADGEVGVLGVLGALGSGRATSSPTGGRFPLADVELLAQIRRPPKFLAIGLNYADHINETGRDRPEFPVFFNKQSTCVTGPTAPIHLPRVSEQVDYEGELGLVIGRACRHVDAADARDVIAGYIVVDDVSARDWQYRAPTWTLGKSFDTHGPIGPWLVTTDEVEDPQQLRLRTFVNGDLRQDASTSDMIFSCYKQVEVLSTVFTLEAGDIISTGTPSGVGIGRKPPEFLRPGDVVRIEIDGIGAIENPVVAEPEDTARS